MEQHFLEPPILFCFRLDESLSYFFVIRNCHSSQVRTVCAGRSVGIVIPGLVFGGVVREIEVLSEESVVAGGERSGDLGGIGGFEAIVVISVVRADDVPGTREDAEDGHYRHCDEY